MYFDEEKNIIAQKLTDDTCRSEKDLMNVESLATSRQPFEVHYPESSIRTMDYGQGHPSRREVTPYTNNNPLLRAIGKRRPLEVYNTYLEQSIVSVKWDYQAKHEMNIETGEAMIRVGENYLGDIARVAWEAFKLKFLDEITRIAAQGNNILTFAMSFINFW